MDAILLLPCANFTRFLRRALAPTLLAALLAAPAQAAVPLDPPAPLTINTGWQLQDVAKLPGATGPALSQPGYQSNAWYKATVPGTVLTSLVNDGVYPEPLYGENNRPERIPDSLCRAAYWYRKTFTVPAAFHGRRVMLNFHGVNYAAEVYVNGHDLGPVRGAFARGRFDISRYVTPDGTTPNAVAVLIAPPPHPGVPQEQTRQNGTGRNGGILAEDGPTFLCAIGWDWIPGIRDRDMGLWQNVTLSSNGPVALTDPYVSSTLPLPSTSSADLTVQATLRNVTERPQFGILIGSYAGTGKTAFRQVYTLRPGETRDVTLTPRTAPGLRVAHPRLWWPNGYGQQNLYTMRLKFVAAAGAVSDYSETSFGIRSIAYSYPASGSDNLTLVVNGVPVIAKGGDWGMDEAMKRIPRERLEAEIRLHKLANYTIIRNWVGQSTSDDFYDLCDKYGILVWDEFFQPNPSDGPNPLDLPLYIDNVREKILRYRSHPSIALWCGRNEGFPPPAINARLTAMIADIDPHRRYQPSSTDGNGVHSGGPYHWRAPRAYYDVDAPFKTEIGSVSIPTLEAVHAMMPPADWNKIGDDDWAEHDLCWGAQQGNVYPAVIAARFGKTGTLAGFVREAQLANYESYRAMYEGRLCRLFAPTSGVITWMSAPAQPSTVWQLYSYDLEPNASLFGARLACEPVHIMLNEQTNHVEVVNNTPNQINAGDAQAVVQVYNMSGDLVLAQRAATTLPASAATDLGPLDVRQTDLGTIPPVYFVRLQLRRNAAGGGIIVSDNFYWRTTAPSALLPSEGDPGSRIDATPAQTAAYVSAAAGDDFTDLNALPPVTLDIRAIRRDAGAKCFLTVTVRNPTHTVALMTHLQLRRARSDQRVLPVYYTDNYFSLVPGETKTLTVECALADLAGEPPALAVDGWNVALTTSSTSGVAVRVMPNDEAMTLQKSLTTIKSVAGM